MIKGAKRNDPDIRIEIHTMTGTTVITGITTIATKRSRRTKNIGATTGIIKEGVVMTTTVRRTSMVDSMGLAHKESIDSIGTNDVTTKVRRITGAKSHTRTNRKHPGIPGECNKTRRSKRHLGIGIHRQLQRKESLVYIVLSANSPDITQLNVHCARAKDQL